MKVSILAASLTTLVAGTGTPKYQVQQVFPGSDAATKGLSTGMAVVSIDGQALDALAHREVEALLLGAAGTTKMIMTSSATLTVNVEDLLAN